MNIVIAMGALVLSVMVGCASEILEMEHRNARDQKFRDDNKELYLLCADSLGISNDSSPLDMMQIRECVKWEKWKNN